MSKMWEESLWSNLHTPGEERMRFNIKDHNPFDIAFGIFTLIIVVGSIGGVLI